MQNDEHNVSDCETAWSKIQHRKLEDWSAKGLSKILSDDWTQKDIVDISITDTPPQFAGHVFRGSRNCPSCGFTVGSENAMPISLYPTMQIGNKKLTVAFGCWMHADCFSACKLSNEQTPIPW
ncbi:MAG: hypothetical protein Aurels2KO_04790 [Aureliella sp.]